MGGLLGDNWATGTWITPAIHLYAVVVLILTTGLYFLHRSRLAELARRIGQIAARIQDKPTAVAVRLDQIDAMVLHLGELIQQSGPRDLRPVLEFVRREERSRNRLDLSTAVNFTVTMIELFPMLGIFGTVWGIAGVSQERLGSKELLVLFGTATSTTLYSLFYVIIFRLVYAAFIESKVHMLEAYEVSFQLFIDSLHQHTLQSPHPLTEPNASRKGHALENASANPQDAV